jgi:uncharacterized repeat protein (TIGR01451 family)
MRLKQFAAVVLSTCALVGVAHAIGTPAGTDISNQAQVSYTLAGAPQTGASNTTTFRVAEVLDLNVTLVSATVLVSAGDTNRTLLFTLTNTGNGSEVFPLALENLVAGDDFDPIAASTAIYFDTDGSGDLSPPDTAYTAGNNDPALAPDDTVAVLLVNDIPAGLTDGLIGRSRLLARAATGTGMPGTNYAGQGSGGTDAVVGARGGQANSTGNYQVSESQVTLAKSATVAGPGGGTLPVPGASITYQIVISVTGSAAAAGFTFFDAIPAGTTFTAGSLQFNGSPLTDAADADAGEFQAGATPSVRVMLGDLNQAAGPQTVAFTVTIN